MCRNACARQLFVSLAIVYRGVDLASLAGVPHFRFSTKIFSSMTITWFAYTCHVSRVVHFARLPLSPVCLTALRAVALIFALLAGR